VFSRNQKSSNARSGRRKPVVSAAILAVGLALTGGLYAAFTATSASAEVDLTSPAVIEEGAKLFAANCATCHGQQAQGTQNGPSLIGVGAAAVDFQVGTGRMPMAANSAQAPVKPVVFTDEQVKALAAYVASLAPGPAIPTESQLQDGNVAEGGELFRINCAMCHNVAGAGGALTEGKYAPELKTVTAVHVYEAMLTGPQNMPVFNDLNLTPEDKKDIIAYLEYLKSHPSAGGLELSSLGPVSEGLFIWILGLGAIIGFTIWITAKSN
jgi:ubiquinol-cytochrome c reductase cytochrome c subunit